LFARCAHSTTATVTGELLATAENQSATVLFGALHRTRNYMSNLTETYSVVLMFHCGLKFNIQCTSSWCFPKQSCIEHPECLSEHWMWQWNMCTCVQY